MAVVECSGSPFAGALEGIPLVKSGSGDILTKPFLDVCRMVLPVLDKFGAAMAMVKSDVGGNITRLDARYREDTSSYYLLHDIVRKEISEKKTKNSNSCTNGVLWLTRAMDFLVTLFGNLLKYPDWTMSQAATDAYNATLKKWHGWIASSAFTVALKLVPERNKFMAVLGEGDLEADIKNFVVSFSPLLQENHDFLQSVGLDDMKAS
eukprot:c12864_g1_i1 orf=122-742(+)